IASGRQIAINGHIKFNLTIPLQQLNGLETLVIIMVANKYAFLQITRRRFLNEWEAFKKVISRRNIRRRITIPLTLSNLKLLRRITRTENILHRNFTRRQVAIQNRVASNIGISQSTFSVKVLNLFSRSRRKTNKRKSKHSAMLRNKETRHRMFIGLCRVSLFLSMALCLLLRLFVFRLLRLKRFSTLSLKVLGLIRNFLPTLFCMPTCGGLNFL